MWGLVRGRGCGARAQVCTPDLCSQVPSPGEAAECHMQSAV
jgi:hypothetical protein